MTAAIICDMCKKVIQSTNMYKSYEHRSDYPGEGNYVDDTLHFHTACLDVLKQGTSDLTVYS